MIVFCKYITQPLAYSVDETKRSSVSGGRRDTFEGNGSASSDRETNREIVVNNDLRMRVDAIEEAARRRQEWRRRTHPERFRGGKATRRNRRRGMSSDPRPGMTGGTALRAGGMLDALRSLAPAPGPAFPPHTPPSLVHKLSSFVEHLSCSPHSSVCSLGRSSVHPPCRGAKPKSSGIPPDLLPEDLDDSVEVMTAAVWVGGCGRRRH